MSRRQEENGRKRRPSGRRDTSGSTASQPAELPSHGGRTPVEYTQCWLRILALCMTAFVTIAGGLGVYSITQVLSLQNQLQQERDKAAAISAEVALAREDVLARKADVERQASAVEGQVRAAVEQLQATMAGEIESLRSTTSAELHTLRESTDGELSALDSRVAQTAQQLADVASTFNRVAVQETASLSAREQQLLVLLASQTDTGNPVYTFNRASWALRFGRYAEAITLFDAATANPDLDPEVAKRARLLRDQAAALASNPPKLVPPSSTGMFLNGVDLLALPVATLNLLVQRGYLTLDEAQTVVDLLPRS